MYCSPSPLLKSSHGVSTSADLCHLSFYNCKLGNLIFTVGFTDDIIVILWSQQQMIQNKLGHSGHSPWRSENQFRNKHCFFFFLFFFLNSSARYWWLTDERIQAMVPSKWQLAYDKIINIFWYVALIIIVIVSLKDLKPSCSK